MISVFLAGCPGTFYVDRLASNSQTCLPLAFHTLELKTILPFRLLISAAVILFVLDTLCNFFHQYLGFRDWLFTLLLKR